MSIAQWNALFEEFRRIGNKLISTIHQQQFIPHSSYIDNKIDHLNYEMSNTLNMLRKGTNQHEEKQKPYRHSQNYRETQNSTSIESYLNRSPSNVTTVAVFQSEDEYNLQELECLKDYLSNAAVVFQVPTYSDIRIREQETDGKVVCGDLVHRNECVIPQQYRNKYDNRYNLKENDYIHRTWPLASRTNRKTEESSPLRKSNEGISYSEYGEIQQRISQRHIQNRNENTNQSKYKIVKSADTHKPYTKDVSPSRQTEEYLKFANNLNLLSEIFEKEQEVIIPKLGRQTDLLNLLKNQNQKCVNFMSSEIDMLFPNIKENIKKNNNKISVSQLTEIKEEMGEMDKPRLDQDIQMINDQEVTNKLNKEHIFFYDEKPYLKSKLTTANVKKSAIDRRNNKSKYYQSVALTQKELNVDNLYRNLQPNIEQVNKVIDDHLNNIEKEDTFCYEDVYDEQELACHFPLTHTRGSNQMVPIKRYSESKEFKANLKHPACQKQNSNENRRKVDTSGNEINKKYRDYLKDKMYAENLRNQQLKRLENEERYKNIKQFAKEQTHKLTQGILRKMQDTYLNSKSGDLDKRGSKGVIWADLSQAYNKILANNV